MSDPDPSLAEETSYLHACMFSKPLDPLSIERYEPAHRILQLPSSHSLVARRIVARRLDPEAVEFALRRHPTGHELRIKMQPLCYLAEVRSEYFDVFVPSKSARLSAIVSLLAHSANGLWKLLKGAYLVRRDGLL